ncbi:MAG: amidohydrolase family protein [Myxococcota bacterium]
MIGWLLAAAAHAACTVISGASVHAPTGLERGLTVVIVDDKIAALGRGMRDVKLSMDAEQRVSGARYRDERCRFVQGAGKHLTAGFVAVPAKLGVVEISLESSTRDDDAKTDDDVRAALQVVDAYDPRSSLIRVSRAEGITSAVVVPEGAFIPGFAGFVKLAGDTQADAVVSRRAALPVERWSGSMAEDLLRIRELVEDTRAFGRNRSSFDSNRPYVEGASRLDLAALQPVVAKQIPMVIYADRASDIEAVLRLKHELNLNVVIMGAAEGWRHARALASAKVPVIVDPMVYGPGSFDQREGRADNPALLAKAGVGVIVTAGFDEPHNARVLRQAAGNAVRGGMTQAQAIRAITETPARVFGESDRGRVAAGTQADLALWSGDPLELSTSLVELWIDGASVDLRTRQTELAKKYLDLPATPPPALSLP